MSRFASELQNFEKRHSLRAAVAAELRESLSRIPGIECTPVAKDCHAAEHLVSFAVDESIHDGSAPEKNVRDASDARVRDGLLTGLYRRGLFVMRTWDIVPAHYSVFAGTFPLGSHVSRRLAATLAHVPVDLFESGRQRKRLVDALEQSARGSLAANLTGSLAAAPRR
jgi:hypothetical protein